MSGQDLRRNLALSLVAFLLGLAVAEGALRLATRPHDDCYGTVLGIHLPPCRLPSPYEPPATILSRSEPYGNLVVDGKRITVEDLWGIARYDPVIGFAPRENAVSVNGWWRTDEVGARVGEDPAEAIDAPVERVLVLGDSYAAGTRLPFEVTWSHHLDRLSSTLEVVNFAMDGYGMAQAYLRYLAVRDDVEHDVVLAMFVPEDDLWRDVNVRRDVGGSWATYWVMPRYVLEGNDLRLVRSPFPDQGLDRPLTAPDTAGTGERLRAHLREFDRFYWEPWWGEPSATFRPAAFRLTKAVVHDLKMRAVREGLMEPGSEAVEIAAAIFRAMRDEAARGGRRFVLVLLPTPNALLQPDPELQPDWSGIVDAVCVDGSSCIDLSEELRALPEEEIDRGYDGSHYGPNVNLEIARILAERLGGRTAAASPTAFRSAGSATSCPCSAREARRPPRRRG